MIEANQRRKNQTNNIENIYIEKENVEHYRILRCYKTEMLTSVLYF